MPLVERIAWDGAQPEDIARRFPDLSLKYGSQVIVMENQWAVFFRDGKAYDVFGPGRHTITSANIPLLTGALRALRIIGDIFDCQVIFVSNSQFRGNFGGQAYSAPSGPIAYQAEMGFYGYLLFQVEDPKLFVIEFFGNRFLQVFEEKLSVKNRPIERDSNANTIAKPVELGKENSIAILRLHNAFCHSGFKHQYPLPPLPPLPPFPLPPFLHPIISSFK